MAVLVASLDQKGDVTYTTVEVIVVRLEVDCVVVVDVVVEFLLIVVVPIEVVVFILFVLREEVGFIVLK